MINSKKILAVIPARGGSKGIPGKNIREVGGRPLLGWTVDAAKRSKYIDRLIVSSDSPEIIRVAKELGCDVPFVRPSELAQDETNGVAPILHAITMVDGYDLVILLQPTSPLRTSQDIDGCVEQCIKLNLNACVSVTEVEQSPFLMYFLDKQSNLKPVMNLEVPYARRQDMPTVYSLNGAVYVADCKWLLKKKTFMTTETGAFVMPNERSIDIDTELDLEMLQRYYEKHT
jgi:N-acylneuraminate cytidylyltransferase